MRVWRRTIFMSVLHNIGRRASLALRSTSLAVSSKCGTARAPTQAVLFRARIFSSPDAKKTEPEPEAATKVGHTLNGCIIPPPSHLIQAADEPKKAADASLLEQTIVKLESDNKDLKERVLRALAEVENMRMRWHFTFFPIV